MKGGEGRSDVILIYYSTIAPFYHIRAKECAKYATLLHCRTGQKYGLEVERQNGRTKPYFISGIINPSFDCLSYNTSGHFADIARIFPRGSEKYDATRKISARII